MPQPSNRTADSQPMRTRALARAASSVDVEARSFEAILTTETPVRTIIPMPGTLLSAESCQWIEVDEVLRTDGLDRSRVDRMPLLACHNAWSLDDYLGQVTEVRAENVEGLGASVVIAAQFKPSRADMAADLAAGFYPNVSAGYVVDEYEVSIREGDVPLAEAVRWTLVEGSLVPIGADPNARVRSAQPSSHPLPAVRMRSGMDFPTQDSPLDFEAQIVAAETALTAADEAVAALPTEAPAGTDAALSQRAAAVRLRSLRAEPAASKKDGDAKAEGNEEEAKAEIAEEKSERSAVAAVRSIAASYGADVAKTVDDLVALGTRSADIRTAVRSAVLARSAATPATVVQPAPQGRSAGASTLSHRDVFSNMNGAFKR